GAAGRVLDDTVPGSCMETSLTSSPAAVDADVAEINDGVLHQNVRNGRAKHISGIGNKPGGGGYYDGAEAERKAVERQRLTDGNLLGLSAWTNLHCAARCSNADCGLNGGGLGSGSPYAADWLRDSTAS